MNLFRSPSSKSLILVTILLMISAFFLAGCAGAAQVSPTAVPSNTPAPTNTPVPTDTPAPTDTPVPTDTPTATSTPEPTSTATPDLQATRAVEGTATAEAVLAPILAQLADLEISADSGSLAWAQDEPFPFTIDTPGASYVEPFAEGVKVGNFVLSTDMSWEATGIVFCGIAFRSESDVVRGRQYQLIFLRFSGLPGWAIEFYKDGFFKNTITDVKFSDAIDLKNGSTNKILLVAENEKFTLYVNGTRQGNFFDYSKQQLEGKFAYLISEDSGESTCTFSNTWIWQLP